MRQKGFSTIIILLGFVLILGIAGSSYYLAKVKNSPAKQQNSSNLPLIKNQPSVNPTPQSLPNADEFIKSNVNYVHASLKQFHAEKGVYPKNLTEFKDFRNIDDNTIKKFSSPPYSYTTSGEQNYSFSAVLSNSEIFQGDEVEINKILDAKVKNDISQLLTTINIFYNEKQRLPQNLDEAIAFIKDFSGIPNSKIKPIDPYNGKQYLYTIHSDNRNFTLSGSLNDNKQYEQESSF